MVWFFLKIWHEECQDNSADTTILNASSDSGLTDMCSMTLNDREKLINIVIINS